MPASDFPGIVLVEGIEGPEIYISDRHGEVINWKYNNLSPKDWLKCLQLVMHVAKFGSADVRQLVRDLSDAEVAPTGATICCNICGLKFKVSPGENFGVKGVFGGKKYNEFQCSSACQDRRLKQLRLTNKFIQLFNK